MKTRVTPAVRVVILACRLLVAAFVTSTIAFSPLFRKSAFAQTPEAPPPGILIATTDEGVRYVAGGVGSDERKMMEQLAAGYNVKFVFADTYGEYVSDVAVRVDDLHGKTVARLVTNGPWLYLKLPSGGYRVRATHAAKTMEVERLQVPKSEGVVLILQWSFNREVP